MGDPNRASTSLLAIIHRLSQPLTALRGSLELALAGEPTAVEYRAALQESLIQADRVISLLKSLREFVEAGEPSSRVETVRLGGLLEGLVEDLRPLAESRGVTLSLKCPVQPSVRAEAQRLRDALFKALRKAIDRSPPGSSLEVSVPTAGSQACLQITDAGPPLDPADLEHLAQPSSLGELFSEATRRGTLEWVVAKRILETLGAAAEIRNQPGPGCCFLVFLPLLPA